VLLGRLLGRISCLGRPFLEVNCLASYATVVIHVLLAVVGILAGREGFSTLLVEANH
jgi:hypothetical protein